ncbi:MAG: hypothetical protein R3D05_12985 [Dongiaceae bacterium]
MENSEFNVSERNRRFLSYVVEETLAGRADRLKAYNIALATFDRSNDFDPLTDPIVRIEASRLRRSLEHYYLTAGKDDRIRIEVPKGSYAANFTYQAETHEQGAATQPGESSQTEENSSQAQRREVHLSWRQLMPVLALLTLLGIAAAWLGLSHGREFMSRHLAPQGVTSLAVIPFEDISEDPKRAFIARGLTYDLSVALSQIRDMAVFGTHRDRVGGPDLHAIEPDYALSGSVQSDRYGVRISVFLIDNRTGQFLRTWSFSKDLITKDAMAVQSEVVAQIVSSLSQGCPGRGDRESLTERGRASFDCGRSIFVAAE